MLQIKSLNEFKQAEFKKMQRSKNRINNKRTTQG